MKVTQIVVIEQGAHEHVGVWLDGKLSGTLVVSAGESDALRAILIGQLKRDAKADPHWLYKDFNVLYRVLANLVGQVDSNGFDQMALPTAKAQLARLEPAFTDTEEVRAAMRGE